MLYTCSRCRIYQTNRKANLKRHMKKKKSCSEFTQNQTLTDSQMTPSDSHITLTDYRNIKFKCQYCNETFTRKNNLNRHIKKTCNENKKNLEIMKLQEENKYLQMQLINNTMINSNINSNNTINNNITINAYGNEDLEHILPKLPILIKYFPTTAVTDLICEAYFDPDHPENKTVKTQSTKEKWAQTFNGEKWEVHKKIDTIMDVLQTNFKFIDNFYESNNTNTSEFMKNKITWEKVRSMWYDDTFPDQEMKDAAEEILTNQNQTKCEYRKFLKKVDK